MENLTLLEQEALEILKQLEYRCESIELHNPEYVKEKKFLEITFGDLNFSVLKKGENIYDVEKYLQKNGLDFSITFDLINEFPDMYIDDKHPIGDFIQLGIIKGENIQSIKTKIKELINKLNNKKPAQSYITILYNKNIGQFLFNEKDTLIITGKQKDVVDCLTEADENIKVSWDEIHDKMIGRNDEQLNDHEMVLVKKSINGAVSEINKKTEKYLEPEKLLIGYKESEYWFQYKVNKNG